MDLDLAIVANRKIAFAPSRDLVELSGVGDGPGIAHIVGGTDTRNGMIHSAIMISGFGSGLLKYVLLSEPHSHHPVQTQVKLPADPSLGPYHQTPTDERSYTAAGREGALARREDLVREL